MDEFAVHTGSAMIKVFVGGNRRLYNLHRSLLCDKSPYFEKCLQPSFEEGTCNEVHLDEDYPEDFDHFVLWIYKEKVDEQLKDNIFSLFMVYGLADKFCMEAFKNTLVDATRNYYTKHSIRTEEILQALEKGSLGANYDGMKKFLVAAIAYEVVTHHTGRIGLKSQMQQLMEVDSKMGIELWYALDTAHRSEKKHVLADPSFSKGCQFHEHRYTKWCENRTGEADHILYYRTSFDTMTAEAAVSSGW